MRIGMMVMLVVMVMVMPVMPVIMVMVMFVFFEPTFSGAESLAEVAVFDIRAGC